MSLPSDSSIAQTSGASIPADTLAPQLAAAAAAGGASVSSGPSRPMTRSQALPSNNIIDMILHEHRLAEQIYWEFKNTEEIALKQKKIYMMIKELSQHAAKEEMVLYPVMKAKLADGPALVAQALAEHQEVKVELAAIDDMRLGQHADLEQRVHKIMADLLQHIQEEETQLLPMLRAALTEDELIQLGHQFVAAASRAPSRPHPELSNQGGFLSEAENLAAKQEDALKDAARDLTKDSGLMGWAPKASGDSAAMGGKSLVTEPNPSVAMDTQ